MTDLRSAVARTAVCDGDTVAIRSGSHTLTYRELDNLATVVTGYLAAHRIGEHSRVVVHMARGLDLFPVLLGILGAGAAFVPIDAAMPADRVLRVVDSCAAALVITDDRNQHVHPENGRSQVVTIADLQAYGATAASVPKADRAAYVLYTSGTTGDPKGVVVGSAGLHRYLNWACMEYQMSAGSGAPLFTSIAFDATLTTLFGPLLVGRSITVLDEDHSIVDLAEMLRRAPDFSFVKATPHHVRLLTELLDGQRLESAARRLIVGGDELDTATVKRWIDICPIPVVNEYGPTETVVGCSTFTVLPDATGGLGPTVPIGRAIAGARLYVLDQNGDQSELGEVGELFIAGPSADNYYLAQPTETAAKFVPDPFSEVGARMYRTQDLAALRPDGVFEFHGRSDRQVKVRGVRVELGEIEAAVRAAPNVVEAAACALRIHHDVTTVVVYTGEAEPHAIRADLLRRVPTWVVPGRLVRTSVLPTTPNAKIDTAAVSALLLDEDTVGANQQTDPLTAGVVSEFGAVLGVHATPDTDFYGSGGDSMSGIRLVARLRRLGHDVRAADVTSYPTPAALAALIAERGTASGQPFAVPAGTEIELTPAQRDFHSLDLPNAAHWNYNVVVRARDELDNERLRAAVLRVALRHEVLRYRYCGGRQVHVGGDPAIAFEQITVADLAGLVGAVHQANTDLDLVDGPLFRVVMARVRGDADHIVLVSHHLIVDEVSWHVFLDDLVNEYGAKSSSRTEPPIAGFAHWRTDLARFAQRSDVRARQQYWDEVLATPVGHLPGVSDESDDYSAEHYRRDGLDTATTTKLRAATDMANVGVHEALLGVVVAALTTMFGIDPPRVDVESHGRLNHGSGVDASRVMGWCTAVFPVALTGVSTLDLIRSARDTLRALEWHGTEFGLLRSSQPAPSRASQILFNYLGERDRVLDHRLGWTVVDPPPGSQSPPTGRRPYVLEFQSWTIDGAIAWEWRAGARYPTHTIKALSDQVRLGLSTIADVLVADQTIRFADSGLSDAELTAVMDRVADSGGGAPR